MVANVWESNFLEQIKRQHLDRRAKKCAPAFLFVLNLDGNLVAPAAQLRFDQEPARTGIRNIWKFQPDIGATTLTARACDPTRPQTIARDQSYSVYRLCLDVDQPAANADGTRVTHSIDRIIETVCKFVFECSGSDHATGSASDFFQGGVTRGGKASSNRFSPSDKLGL